MIKRIIYLVALMLSQIIYGMGVGYALGTFIHKWPVTGFFIWAFAISAGLLVLYHASKMIFEATTNKQPSISTLPAMHAAIHSGQSLAYVNEMFNRGWSYHMDDASKCGTWIHESAFTEGGTRVSMPDLRSNKN